MRIRNLNGLAVAITKLEGKKKQVDIAQVKEILYCLRRLLCEHPFKVLTILTKGL